VAYYQLATAAGFLRASAATARTRPRGPDSARAQLPGALERLRQLRPPDPGLRSAVRDLGSAITRWLAAAGSARSGREARAALGVTSQVLAALQSFLRRHRGLAGSIPD
jgi:hypothetical protein